MRHTVAAVAAVALLTPSAHAQNSACFGHSDRDMSACDDGNSKTKEDHCYEGFCGGWLSVPSVVWSEAEREDWIEHDGDAPCIAGETVSRCGGHGATTTGGATMVQDHAGLCAGVDDAGGSFNLPLCGGCASGGVNNGDCMHTDQCVGAHDAADMNSVSFFGNIHTTDEHAGHFGSGFADYSGASGGEKITWTLQNCAAGYYHLNFGYALRSGNRPMRVYVNDKILGGCASVDRRFAADGNDDGAKCELSRAFGKAHLLSFPETGGWANWGQIGTKAYLMDGPVTITLESAGFQGPNIDGLEVLPACGSDSDGHTTCSPFVHRRSPLHLNFWGHL